MVIGGALGEPLDHSGGSFDDLGILGNPLGVTRGIQGHPGRAPGEPQDSAGVPCECPGAAAMATHRGVSCGSGRSSRLQGVVRVVRASEQIV